MAMEQARRLSRDNLQVGMHVNQKMLASVFGVYVFVDSYGNNEFDGNILYFCDDIDSDEAEAKIEEIEQKHGGTCMYYLPKSYEEEDFAIYE